MCPGLRDSLPRTFAGLPKSRSSSCPHSALVWASLLWEVQHGKEPAGSPRPWLSMQSGCSQMYAETHKCRRDLRTYFHLQHKNIKSCLVGVNLFFTEPVVPSVICTNHLYPNIQIQFLFPVGLTCNSSL